MKIDNFVIFPRKILQDLRNGELTPNECWVYCYIRLSGNPYGVTAINLRNIADDAFNGNVSTNYCNKLLLSLKQKRYVYYSERRGRRGSFEIQLGDWMLPNKTVKSIEHYFEQAGDRGGNTTESPIHSEVRPNLTPPSQTFEGLDLDFLNTFSPNETSGIVRTPYNDKEIDKDKYVYRSKTPFEKGGLILTEGYEANSADEFRCWEIAKDVGEKHMNFTLAALRNHGLSILEKAYGIFKEDRRTKKIKNGGAYLNGVIKQLLENRGK